MKKIESGSEREREREQESMAIRQIQHRSFKNGPEKGGEMSHLFFVGATVGPHEKAVREMIERAKERTSAM